MFFNICSPEELIGLLSSNDSGKWLFGLQCTLESDFLMLGNTLPALVKLLQSELYVIFGS